MGSSVRGTKRLGRCVGVIAVAVLTATPAAGASGTTGRITSQSAWLPVATLARGVTVARKTVAVSGYGSVRTLTRIAWPLGSAHVTLDATPTAIGRYGGVQHSFAEGQISTLGPSVHALAGINGDTYCEGCATNGGDLLHGLLVHGRRIFATGYGPEVGYLPGGRMKMGIARAVPVKLTLPNETATIAAWDTFSIPGRHIAGDQVVALAHAGARFTLPIGWTAVRLAGKMTAYRHLSTVGAQFRNMLRLAAPYKDSADRVAGSRAKSEWINAYHVSQVGGVPSNVRMPVSGGVVTTPSVVVPRNGVIIAAATGTSAAVGLKKAAARGSIPVTLDDTGWNLAQTIMDGKFQMVKSGVAQTTYPGWKYSWPWWCQGPRMGCVRTAVGQTRTQGWMIVVADPGGSGLTMPDFARVLAQLGVKSAMAFDSNTHADFWRKGATPITAGGGEPPVPAATLVRYH